MERGSAAPPRSSAPAAVRYRVAGVALGGFPLVDGKPADFTWQAQAMVAAFVPGTVPILRRHGGLPCGDLDELRCEDADLHFRGWIFDYPDILERLTPRFRGEHRDSGLGDLDTSCR